MLSAEDFQLIGGEKILLELFQLWQRARSNGFSPRVPLSTVSPAREPRLLVGLERLVTVQLPCKFVHQLIQACTSNHKLVHRESHGLVSMFEALWCHGEEDPVILLPQNELSMSLATCWRRTAHWSGDFGDRWSRRTIVRGQLSSDGGIKRLHQLYTQVVASPSFTVLFQDSVEPEDLLLVRVFELVVTLFDRIKLFLGLSQNTNELLCL